MQLPIDYSRQISLDLTPTPGAGGADRDYEAPRTKRRHLCTDFCAQSYSLPVEAKGQRTRMVVLICHTNRHFLPTFAIFLLYLVWKSSHCLILLPNNLITWFGN
jgi:hypothetical protein